MVIRRCGEVALFPVQFLAGISVEHGSSGALVEAVVGGCTQVARFYGGLTRVHTMIFVRFFLGLQLWL